MKNRHLYCSFLLLVASLWSSASHAADTKSRAPYGILLLAHGGGSGWNQRVDDLVQTLDDSVPTEVAFGMAQRGAIQSAVRRLEEQGVGSIVAVPLFVSSHSSVITATEYLLGVRDTAPPELARFASMKHGHGGHGEHSDSATDPQTLLPVVSAVPIRWCSPLDDAPVVSDILLTRIRSVSRDPANEVVIVVAHGPVADDENQRWLANMKTIVDRIAPDNPLQRIEYLTVRDDAPEPIRSNATAELRARVSAARSESKGVLIVPLLISYDGIEKGVRKRLEGLEYEMPSEGLIPDPRIASWVLETASVAARTSPLKASQPAENHTAGASR
jgi:hypothetical protein